MGWPIDTPREHNHQSCIWAISPSKTNLAQFLVLSFGILLVLVFLFLCKVIMDINVKDSIGKKTSITIFWKPRIFCFQKI